METVLMIVLGIASLVIIVSVMFQQGNGNGAAALGGNNGTAAKKAKGYEALLSKITIVATVCFVVLSVVLVVLE